MIWKSIKIFWQPWGYRGCPHQKKLCVSAAFWPKKAKSCSEAMINVTKIYFMVFERYIPELKKIWWHFISTSAHDLRTASENRSKTYGAPCMLCSEPCFFACFYILLLVWIQLETLHISLLTVSLHSYLKKSKFRPKKIH